MNQSDGERIAGLLESHGCSRISDEAAADVIIVISCSVRQKAMDRIFGKLNAWDKARKKRGLRLVLTGCVLPADRKRLANRFDHILSVRDVKKLPALLGLARQQTATRAITNADYLELPSLHESPFQAFVPIMTGCNNYCTYCAVPYTRGEEASRPSSEIISEVKQLIHGGYKEITLLGQNVNAYIDPETAQSAEILQSRARSTWQFKKNQPLQWRTATTNVPKDFAVLLQRINGLPGDFWIRFLTSNPQDVSDELLATLPRCQKITRYFHLPFQAGDDEILRRMNRRHARTYYLDLINKIRSSWPGVTISTDVIVGFPGETAAQFKKTVDVMETVGFDMAYIAEYSPRPGTASARFFKDDVPKKEKTRRKTILNEVLKKTALERNQQLVGTATRVLVERYNKRTGENAGKTETFKTIHFPGIAMIGQFADVEITEATAWGLRGIQGKIK